MSYDNITRYVPFYSGAESYSVNIMSMPQSLFLDGIYVHTGGGGNAAEGISTTRRTVSQF